MVKASTRRLCFGIKADGGCDGDQTKYQTTGAYYEDEFVPAHRLSRRLAGS